MHILLYHRVRQRIFEKINIFLPRNYPPRFLPKIAEKIEQTVHYLELIKVVIRGGKEYEKVLFIEFCRKVVLKWV